MKRVSITEAKNGLSALIDRVRHGEPVLIEDRGVPVARIESVAGARGAVEGRVERLVRQGVLRAAPGRTARRALTTPPPTPRGPARGSDLLVSERRSGR